MPDPIPPLVQHYLNAEARAAIAAMEEENSRRPPPRLHGAALRGPHRSDLVDADGLQYVDVVMEGGGVLGIALLGSLFVFEHAGLRFRSIGGTSAGAITATLLAAAGAPHEAKTDRILDIVAGTKFSEFVDGGPDAKALTDALFEMTVRGRGLNPLRLAVPLLRNWKELRRELGLNHGVVFEDWLRTHLHRAFGIETTHGLLQRLREPKIPISLNTADGLVPQDAEAIGAGLRLVAAELVTKSKIVFPDMAELFFDDPGRVNPARFVRASMAVPGFFRPMRLAPLPPAGERWKDLVGWTGEAPAEAVFVDGGVISNFPISLFHARPSRIPRCPTLGIKLGISRHAPASIAGPAALCGAMFAVARQASDLDFLWRNPDYRRLVHTIDTEPVHWLDFFLSDEHQRLLFSRGVVAAAEFLCGFNWAEHKAQRAKGCVPEA